MSGWFGDLLTSIQQKSENIINMYKEDLQEFTSTITEDTKKAIETNVTAVNAMGGISGIINQISTISINNNASPSSNTNDTETSVASHLDPSTYSKDPEDIDDYNAWLSTFDIKTKTEEISQLLASDEHMHELHQELVPAVVSYGDFWQKYFYYYSKMKEKEDRRAALLQKANAAIASEDNDEDLGWDIDEFENENNDNNIVEQPKKEIPTESEVVSKKEDEIIELSPKGNDNNQPEPEKEKGDTNNDDKKATNVASVTNDETKEEKKEKEDEKVEDEKKEPPKESTKEDAGEEEWDDWE